MPNDPSDSTASAMAQKFSGAVAVIEFNVDTSRTASVTNGALESSATTGQTSVSAGVRLIGFFPSSQEDSCSTFSDSGIEDNLDATSCLYRPSTGDFFWLFRSPSLDFNTLVQILKDALWPGHHLTVAGSSCLQYLDDRFESD